MESRESLKRVNSSLLKTEALIEEMQKTTKPFSERSPAILKNVEESTDKLNRTLADVRDLMTVFFATHDPSSVNRQGNDVGDEYRSAIFYTTDEQKAEAQKMIEEIDVSSSEGGKVVTEVTPLGAFYPAEEYHKDYFAKNPEKGYCQIVINPKVEKVQAKFAALLKQVEK